MTRPDWDEWAMGIARAWARRGDCTRRQVGAVILDVDHRQVGGGYNGTSPGQRGCLDGACPRGKHYPISLHGDGISPPHVCTCGESPCHEESEPGSDYGNCIALHAEVNACLDAGRRLAEGGTMYVTEEPCDWCRKVIRASGIIRVVFPGGEFSFLRFAVPETPRPQ